MYLLSAAYSSDSMLSLVGTMIGTGAATMVFMLALFYMAAQFFKKPEYEAFVSIEIYQLAVSLMLFTTIFGAAYFANELSASFSSAISGTSGDAFDVGSNYLNYVANEVALQAIKKLQGLMLLSQWMGSITMRFGAGVWGVVVPAFPSFIVIEKVMEFLLMLVSPFTASLIVQQVGLQIIKATMLPFVLPMGVVLRIFPPTRDAGSFIISTALAFQVIFPFSYVMHAQIVKGILIPNAYANEKNVADYMTNTLGAGRLTAFVSENGLFDITSMLFSPILSLSFLLLQAVFLPALSMVLTVAFIKSFNKFISQKFS
ncbi:MAG: hypothetical protein WCY41_01800 [Candidatus Micrarchaeia archaeon]